MAETNNYSQMKKDELLAIAKEMGAKVSSKTKKADIIAAIEELEKASSKKPEELAAAKAVKEAEEKIETAAPAAEVKEETAEPVIILEDTVEEDPSADYKEDEETEEPEAAEAAEVKAAETETQQDGPVVTFVEETGDPVIILEEPAEEDAEAKAVKKAEDKVMKASTERNRREKAERREAKAARKEANRIEEKKKRPSNTLIAILIFGILIGMFVFIGGYRYFNKPVSIEKYMEDQGVADMYTSVPYDEHSTITIRADKNTLKMLVKVDESLSKKELKEYKSEEFTDELKEIAASWLASIKPETQGFNGTVKVAVKQGDKTVNSFSMSYHEAKKYVKEAEKKADEEAEKAMEEAQKAAEEAEAQAGSAEAVEEQAEAAEAAAENAEEQAEAADETATEAAETAEEAAAE